MHYGAVQRLRPKLMIVLTTFMGLLPIMWASTYETGADVMKRMAAPMVGGLTTSFILGLTIYPAVFFVWKRYEMEGLPATLGDWIPFANQPPRSAGEIDGIDPNHARAGACRGGVFRYEVHSHGRFSGRVAHEGGVHRSVPVD